MPDWLRAHGVARRHKTAVPTAQRIVRLDWNFMLPPSLAVRETRGAVWRSKQIGACAVSSCLQFGRVNIFVKGRSGWFGPPTLYACLLPRAMEWWLFFWSGIAEDAAAFGAAKGPLLLA
jgi:hypothetical protein